MKVFDKRTKSSSDTDEGDELKSQLSQLNAYLDVEQKFQSTEDVENIASLPSDVDDDKSYVKSGTKRMNLIRKASIQLFRNKDILSITQTDLRSRRRSTMKTKWLLSVICIFAPPLTELTSPLM